MLKHSVKTLILLSFFVSPWVLADEAAAPVVAITPAPADTVPVPQNVPASSPAVSTLPLDQRVAVLERQISAMNQIDLVNQMTRVEQQIQDLQGQVQVLSHTLQTLQSQTTNQYADLDKRLQTESTPSAPSTSSSTPAAKGTSKSTVASDPKAEQKIFNAAYKDIREQKNTAGIEGMKKYLTKYPDGQYAPSAHYWLGQVYLLKGDDKSVKNAVTEFDTVIKNYPKTDKARDASLKLGFAYLLQNKTSDARHQFKKVMKDYPGTSAAEIAKARLAQLS